MKVAILQWCRSVDHGEGSIERISTTAKDCVEFFKMQMKSLGKTRFIAGESQITIDNEELRNKYDQFIENDYDALQDFIQKRYLDCDSLGVLYIKGLSPEEYCDEERYDYHWWKIMFRNIH